jgi:hypothetical protein
MARRMHSDAPAVYRAVIETTYQRNADYAEEVLTSYAGPFTTVGQAASAVSRRARDATNANQWVGRPGSGQRQVVVGRIERATLAWEPVE